MMNRFMSLALAGMMVMGVPALAEDEFVGARILYPESDLDELPFDKETGCYVDTNAEVEFPFTVKKKGIYVFIQMFKPIGDLADPNATFMGGREVELTMVPSIDIPLKYYDSMTLVAHLERTGKYVVGFGPNAAHGETMTVRICKRVTDDLGDF